MEFETKEPSPKIATIEIDSHTCAGGMFTTENGAEVKYKFSPTDVRMHIGGKFFAVSDLSTPRNFIDYSIERLRNKG